MGSQDSVTGLLEAVRQGDGEALHRLFPLVYEELHALARAQRHRWHGDLTLNATAIVHEAYIKLVEQRGGLPEDRGRFLAVAAKAMRHILCNYARDRRRQKRGGGAPHVALDEAVNVPPFDLTDDQAIELAALDAALERLERLDERQSRVVECRFFGGLSIEETAASLGLSAATVKRDWTMARAWLFRELQKR